MDVQPEASLHRAVIALFAACPSPGSGVSTSSSGGVFTPATPEDLPTPMARTAGDISTAADRTLLVRMKYGTIFET